MNAILNKNSTNVKGCRLYTSLFPCNECAKMCIQSGITEVIYLSDKYHDEPMSVASRRMFDMAGVKYRQLATARKQLVINFDIDTSVLKV